MTSVNDLSVIPYSPEYQGDFKRLNVAWISALFALEPHDLEQLDHPEIHILPNNGAIFLAQSNGNIVGTVAMIKTGEGEFELAKMSVTPAVQGRGAGNLLALAAIDYARGQNARVVWLESNRKAQTALRLYERVGFREVPLIPSPYARADIRMEMVL
ncbi:GNAT family N-acetyltransferase [Spirosoma spitsbergense]|uniref:GNAT family N-acetyltransferase n=1 Tax=Spirosoma spitsbergense TaxID=431554 RepID=UPI00036382CC|nr:GNAT family N-acetyltransferase [Spirosoma spitsbergense]